MSWKKYKYIYFGLFLVLLVSSGLSYYWMANSQPQNKPKISVIQESVEEVFKISEEIKVILNEKYSVCVKYDLKCPVEELELTGSERDELNGLTLKELEKYYSSNNKTVGKSKDGVIITTWKEGLCPEHKNIWHLGDNDTGEFVAVYYGPRIVKNEGEIFKLTEIPVTHLPIEYQEKIRTHAMEFYDEEELIATLDSLSE